MPILARLWLIRDLESGNMPRKPTCLIKQQPLDVESNYLYWAAMLTPNNVETVQAT